MDAAIRSITLSRLLTDTSSVPKVSMRIVTWNCYRGSISQRLSRLKPLNADFVALQECAAPSSPSPSVLWRGEYRQQGVAVVDCRDSGRVRPCDCAPLPGTVIAAHVTGAQPFVLANVWSHRNPSYADFSLDAVRAVKASVARAGALVVVGDLNSTRIPRDNGHDRMMRTLADEFGLISAYHAFHGVATGDEQHPTHYFLWKRERPFHIDYVFVPAAWMPRIRSVEVGGFEDWPDSDHRPVAVELAQD